MKHIPMRTCIVCREQKDKKALVRLVLSADGTIAVDNSGKLPGRGAYICADGDCAMAVQKKRALDRAFKTKFPDTEYARIAEELAAKKDDDGNG